jgi:hypothetical protein
MTILSEMKDTFESIMADSDFGAQEAFTVKSLAQTYGTSGVPSKSWSGTDTFYGDFQAVSGRLTKEEAGLKKKSTHIIIAYNTAITRDLNGEGKNQNMIVKTGNEAGNYMVNYVRIYNIHCEIMLYKVIGDQVGSVS